MTISDSDQTADRHRKYRRLRKLFLTLGTVSAFLALFTFSLGQGLYNKSNVYCSAIVDRPGQVRVNEPFRITVQVEREQCSPASFARSSAGGTRLEVNSIPSGDYVEAKLQSREELSIKAESELSKPIPDDGPATWTWELEASEAERYSLSVQFVLRNAQNDKDIRESSAEYFTIEAIDSNWGIVKKTVKEITTFLTDLNGALTSLSALLLLIASFFGFKERKEANQEGSKTNTDT